MAFLTSHSQVVAQAQPAHHTTFWHSYHRLHYRQHPNLPQTPLRPEGDPDKLSQRVQVPPRRATRATTTTTMPVTIVTTITTTTTATTTNKIVAKIATILAKWAPTGTTTTVTTTATTVAINNTTSQHQTSTQPQNPILRKILQTVKPTTVHSTTTVIQFTIIVIT